MRSRVPPAIWRMLLAGLLMAEVMGYDTAPMEGFEQDKVHEVLRLPMSY